MSSSVNQSYLPVLFLVLIGSVVFLVGYNYTDSYISTSDKLAFELRSPADSIYTWKIRHEVPFSYRLLFPTVVHGTWVVVRRNPYDNDAFMAVYRGWCYVFFLTSIISFYGLLHVMGFSRQQVFAGSLIFTILPAMSFAFAFPVHTREDLLGYTLLNLGLIAFLRKKKLQFLLIAIISVFCRETLLILPFLYFFYSKERPLTRIVISALPAITWVLLRWTAGIKNYDAIGLSLNDNLENIFQTLTFLLISFNVLWVLFFCALASGKEFLSKELKLIFDSAWPAVFLVLGSAFFLGRIMEIRLLYLLAPWIIPLALYGVSQHRQDLRNYFQSTQFMLVTIGSGFFLSLLYGVVWWYCPGWYNMMEGYWWTVLFLSTTLCIISVPLVPSMARRVSIK